MKKLISIIALVAAVFLAGCVKDYPSEIAVYKFDTAVIQYEYTGSQKGEATLYVRGDQKAMYKTFGEKSTLEIDLGEKGYDVNMDKGTAIEVANPNYETLKGMSANEQEIYLVKEALGLKDYAEAPVAALKKVVAGKTCNVYAINNIGSACIWSGIVLEKEVTIQDVTNKQVAVSVQTDVEVSAAKFELPANVILQ
ncbi:hypothetical protein ACFL3T_01430 [Patescibacteria group bacterium]